jgi:hypothetical protein
VRATISLPLPLSPVMKTETAVPATRAICSYTLRIGGEVPQRAPKWPSFSSCELRSPATAFRAEGFITRDSTPCSCFRLIGLTR